MINYLTDEEVGSYKRHLGALAHNANFESVTSTFKRYLSSLDASLRTTESEIQLRHIQGKAQMLSELIDLIEAVKSGKV